MNPFQYFIERNLFKKLLIISLFYSHLLASEEKSCQKLLSQIIIKKVDIEQKKTQKAIESFWHNKNGTFIGARYYKGTKYLAKKAKVMFMDINSNFRPIYYIENDGATYPKIFKYIELVNSKENGPEILALKKEIDEWISKYKSYDIEMENLILEYSTLAAYIARLRELKRSTSSIYPFEIHITLYKNGKGQLYKDYMGSEEDIENLILKLSGKLKNLKGTSFFRFGSIDDREFAQALLRERLHSLESEIRNNIANNPASEDDFKVFLEQLIIVNRDPRYAPTLKFATKLELKEMNSEYKDLFKTAELDYSKLDEFSKKVIENLSPRYQEKLGLKAAKNWVATMKAGRMGVVVAGVGSLGTGAGALALRFWNWLNYDDDSIYNIINAKDETEFETNLKAYLKGKYPIELLTRLERKNENEMTLKNFNPKHKEDVEILKFINGVVVERKKYIHEEKLLSDLEDNLGKIIEDIRTNSDQEKPTGISPDPTPKIPSSTDNPQAPLGDQSLPSPIKNPNGEGRKKQKDKKKKHPQMNLP